MVGVGIPHLGNRNEGQADAASRLEARIAGVRSAGSAALELAWTAAGRYDGYCHYRLDPWDFAAGALIIREAGGFVTDLSGRDPGPILAGNQPIHRELQLLLTPMPQH